MIRRAASVIEFVLLGLLILAARCVNYQNVFIDGNSYFTDADCYARMTRVRICLEHAGVIIRHHDFENFPLGTTPHTTAPFDYLIVALATLLRPITGHALDLAGAMVSPVLGLSGGWFLWWWFGRMRFPYRPAGLLLYALSPIIVHATELGRPDHQSLVLVLIMVAVCAEWRLQRSASRAWSIVSGAAWGLALWISLYEPLVLLAIVIAGYAIRQPQQLLERHRRMGWSVLIAITATAALVERRAIRVPNFFSSTSVINWSRTIGELAPVPIFDPIWFHWCGYFLILAPILAWLSWRKNSCVPLFIGLLLCATFGLTLWQARWGYLFCAILALVVPFLLGNIERRLIAWLVVAGAFLPILADWEDELFPNESRSAERLDKRRETVELRDVAFQLESDAREPFLAAWWFSPALAYWSGQPAVAGSSHESIGGIADTARFFTSVDVTAAGEILKRRGVAAVVASAANPLTSNSASILGTAPPVWSLGQVLDRSPSRAPAFLQLTYQNAAFKIYRVRNSP